MNTTPTPSDPRTDATIAILHVDDEPGFADLAAEFLEREDDRFECTTATSAAEALEHLSRTDLDCIISDYDMPGMNGVEFLEAVRETHPKIPFILYTGKGSEAVASEAISAGVTDYLQKASGTDQYKLLATQIANLVSRTRAERRVAETERRLREMSESTTDVLWMFTHDWSELLFLNSAYDEIWGRSAETLADHPLDFVNGVHPEDRASVERAMATLSGGDSIDIEFRVDPTQDYQRWVWVRGAPIFDADGAVVRVAGFVRDVTHRKRSEQALCEEQEFVEQALDTLDDIFYVGGTDGSLCRWNDSLRAVSGYTDAEIADMQAIEFFPPEERDRVAAAIERVLTTGHDVIETTVLTADGDRLPYELTGRRLTDVDGDVSGFVGVGRNIAQRKERQEELQRHEALIESLPDSVYMYDSEQECVYVNQRAIDASPERFSRDDLLGASLPTLLECTLHDSERIAELMHGVEQIVSGDRERMRETLRFEIDGEVVYADAIATCVRDAEGAPLGLVNVLRNITDRVEAERELERQNDRLERLVSGVSHDLRNPLNVAEGRLELAREEYDNPHLAETAWSLGRMRTLIDDLLTLARDDGAVETESLSLRAVVAECWQAVDTRNATLSIDTEQAIRADAGRLKRLLENLIRNAVEHDGDDVTIAIGSLDESSGFYVEDDGPGIPESERAEVFENGYSTTSGGSGFGLAIVEQAATAHGWQIDLVEGRDGGTRFEITGVETSR